MAENQTVTFSDKPASAKQKEKDYQEHQRTYQLFLQLSKWGVISTAVVLIVLYFWLVN